MASLTITIEPGLLEAAQLEAERRHTSLDRMVTDLLETATHRHPTDTDIRELLDLMDRGPLGHIDRPLTRDEIYAERTWPRS